MKYIVPSALPLMEVLVSFFPKSSKTTIRSWIKEGRIFVDGQPVTQSNAILSEGQEITLGQKRKFIEGNIEIIYEDNDFVVIDKPTKLLSVAAVFEKEQTAHALLKAHYYPRQIYIVHRIDQDTSGVMLFAFNSETCERLKKIFEAHDIKRSYTAIVEGQMKQYKGTWTSYLYEDSNYMVHQTDDPHEGEEATTHFELQKIAKRYSYVIFTLETGKKNQIRVQCQAAGHPVAGDKKYGAKTNPVKRLCLHAHLLSFKHPYTQKLMRFESAPPKEFFQLL